MSLAFGFHPAARAEFIADVDWYDEREAGVGTRLEDAVHDAIEAACDDPDAWASWPDWERDPMVRSKGVTGFPYRVVYFVQNDLLTMVAVAHTKRRPGDWRSRISL